MNKIVFTFLFMLLNLTSCNASIKKYDFQWGNVENKPQLYKTAITSISSHDENEVIINKLSSYVATIDELDITSSNQIKELFGKIKPQNDWPDITSVTKRSVDSFRIKTYGAPVDQDVSPITDEEKLRYKISKSKAGIIQLLIDINASGKSLSLFLNRKQQNLSQLLFKLPDSAIPISGMWDVPLNLIELGNGYAINKASHYNKGFLLSTKTINQEKIANIVILVKHHVDGEYLSNILPAKTTKPFSLDVNYIAYAEYSFKHKKWKSYLGFLIYNGTGQIPVKSTQKFALQPMN